MTLSCYVHVPFCARICTYCDFYRIVSDSEWEARYIDAICREILLRTASFNLNSVALETLYFGGGTPTVLAVESWEKVISTLRTHFEFSPTIEFTFEANPESSTPEKLSHLRKLGANRVSFGAQSFNETNLKRLGRLHNANQVGVAIATARSAGLENISLDLMYGLPDETEESFLTDLQTVVSLDPCHISFYALMLEGAVPLRYQVQKKELVLPHDDIVADRYCRAVGFLSSHGYQHYEISNFAKPAKQCNHNLAYWRHNNYIAFGPAAVGTIGDLRYKNEPDIYRYVKDLAQNKLPNSDNEVLNEGKRLIETIMLSLRLRSGLDHNQLKLDFGYDILNVRKELIDELQSDGDLILENGSLCLTPRGMFRSDLIAASLLPDFV